MLGQSPGGRPAAPIRPPNHAQQHQAPHAEFTPRAALRCGVILSRSCCRDSVRKINLFEVCRSCQSQERLVFQKLKFSRGGMHVARCAAAGGPGGWDRRSRPADQACIASARRQLSKQIRRLRSAGAWTGIDWRNALALRPGGLLAARISSPWRRPSAIAWHSRWPFDRLCGRDHLAERCLYTGLDKGFLHTAAIQK